MPFPTVIEEGRFQTLRETLAPLAHLFRNRDVLDFGASYALSICAILELGARSVIGTEPDYHRVIEGRRTLEEQGHYDAVLLHTSYSPEIPLPDASVDVVLANAVLEHIPQPRDAYLRELWRVLRPGGHLVINETPNKYLPWDFHTTKLPLINWLPSRAAHAIAKALGRLETVNDPWHASGWRGLGYFEMTRPLSGYTLVPETEKLRHRWFAMFGIPASILDPYPLWVLEKQKCHVK